MDEIKQEEVKPTPEIPLNSPHASPTPHADPENFFSQMTSKIAFIFGLIVGIAAMSTIGFIGLLVSPNTALVTSAQEDTNAVAANNTNPSPTPTNAYPEPTNNPDAVVLSDSDHIRGDKNAPITIVEFSDFQCPFCQSFHPSVQKLVDNYPGKVRWIWKHFPLSFHAQAQTAAEASECAAEQGKFWEYSDKLFENQALFTQSGIFEKIAGELGLNAGQFSTCLSSGKYSQKVEDDYSMGVAAGVSGTPGSFINDVYVAGAKSYDSLEQIVESLL